MYAPEATQKVPARGVSTCRERARHVVTYRYAAVRLGSRVSLDLIDNCTRKSPLDLRQVLGALGQEILARRTPFGKKGGRAMKGTRTRTRTHTTPPLKRPLYVAPVGCPRSGSGSGTHRLQSYFSTLGHLDFRAGGQHGQLSTREAETS